MALSAAGSCAVAFLAWRTRALTTDGAAAAALVGFVVMGWGGLPAAVPLLLFFVSGTWLTRWSARRRKGGPAGGSARATRTPTPHRDTQGRRASQVAANGGVAAAAVVAGVLWPHPVWAAAYAGAVATATADTWATEVGAFSRRPPVLVTTGAPVAPGRSGAVSPLGTCAGAAGAVLIALSSAISWELVSPAASHLTASALLPVAAGGFLGMLADSVLGATAQERFVCCACGAFTEQPRHFCRPGGAGARRAGGWPWFNNDTVNFTSALIGASVAAALFRLLGP